MGLITDDQHGSNFHVGKSLEQSVGQLEAQSFKRPLLEEQSSAGFNWLLKFRNQ